MYSDWRISQNSRPASFDAAPSTPRPTGAAGGRQVGDPAHPGAEPRVRRRAVRDAGAGRAESLRPRRRRSGSRARPRRRTRPSPSVEQFGRTLAEAREAVVLLLEGLGEVRVHAQAVPARQLGRCLHQLGRTENGLNTARRRPSPCSPSWWRAITDSVDARIASRSSTTWSGGRPPSFSREVHRTARQVQAHADLARRVDDGVEHACRRRAARGSDGRTRSCTRLSASSLDADDARPRARLRLRAGPTPDTASSSQPNRSQPTARPRVIHWNR